MAKSLKNTGLTELITLIKAKYDAILGVANGKVSKSGDTMTGDLAMGSNKITGLAAPTANGDAANKKYADDQDTATLNSAKAYTDAEKANYLPLSGGTVSGNISFSDVSGINGAFFANIESLKIGNNLDANNNPVKNVPNPVSNGDAANKKYVDDSVSGATTGFLKADGSVPMTGALQMGLEILPNKIMYVADPTLDGDATNKKYVDDADSELSARIDTIEARTDVVDVVGTKAELLAYDITKISINDIIKVLADESHNGAISYYRYATVSETAADRWTLLGTIGPYYTKSETDTSFLKQTDAASTYIKIDGSNSPMSGELKMGSHKVTGLAAPTADADAATKKYVDDEAAKKFDITGGTISGDVIVDGSLSTSGINTFSAFSGEFSSINVSGVAIDGSAIDMKSNATIVNLKAPSNYSDAATKGYVDDSLFGVTVNFVARSGDYMTGDLALGNSVEGRHHVTDVADMPASGTDIGFYAANKNYVDNQAFLAAGNAISAAQTYTDGKFADAKTYTDGQIDDVRMAMSEKLSTTGGSMTGEIAMGSNKITGLAAPTADGDATTKKYVDDQVAVELSAEEVDTIWNSIWNA